MPPLFSIGVTTFDRDELLRQTLVSIAGQTFKDFEVLISNDNPARKVSAETVGIKDPRFKFINQDVNLGEIRNMNYLLNKSSGRYFTWLADDDLYLPEFLASVYEAITSNSLPEVFFTAFDIPRKNQAQTGTDKITAEVINGNEFFYRYSRGLIKAISVMGVYEINTLKRMGGMEDLSGDGRGMFAEYALFAKVSALDKVGYIKKPLVLFRPHGGSLSGTSTDITMYRRGADNLTRQAIGIFCRQKSKKYFYFNLLYILKVSLLQNLVVMSRRKNLGDSSLKKILAYFAYAAKYIEPLKGSGLYLTGFLALLHAEIGVIFDLLGYKVRDILWKRRQS